SGSFAPRRRGSDLVIAAGRRGVDVRLLLPGRSDVPLVRHAGHGHYGALLEGGVRIFEYQAAVLHAKTLVADDFVCAIGSSNLDFRSFHLNAEGTALTPDEATAATFWQAFEEDPSKSVEIAPALWSRRTFRHRAGAALARTLGPFL